jgi:hypothetical protein
MMHESDATRLWGNTIRRHIEAVSTPRERQSPLWSWSMIFGALLLAFVCGFVAAAVVIGKGVVH